jgi:hypothetical protein
MFGLFRSFRYLYFKSRFRLNLVRKSSWFSNRFMSSPLTHSPVSFFKYISPHAISIRIGVSSSLSRLAPPQDVLRTGSWQVQLSGAKLWHICAPSESRWLYGEGSSPVDAFRPDYAKYPLFANADCFGAHTASDESQLGQHCPYQQQSSGRDFVSRKTTNNHYFDRPFTIASLFVSRNIVAHHLSARVYLLIFLTVSTHPCAPPLPEDTVGEGEMIFYPADYWHQTRNLKTPSIAVTGTVLDQVCIVTLPTHHFLVFCDTVFVESSLHVFFASMANFTSQALLFRVRSNTSFYRRLSMHTFLSCDCLFCPIRLCPSTSPPQNNWRLIKAELEGQCATNKWQWKFSPQLCAALKDSCYEWWRMHFDEVRAAQLPQRL